jgi:hypothetical protein
MNGGGVMGTPDIIRVGDGESMDRRGMSVKMMVILLGREMRSAKNHTKWTLRSN